MVEVTLPDSINYVIWTLTTDPEPMADGKIMLSEFVDITAQAKELHKPQEFSIIQYYKDIYTSRLVIGLGIFVLLAWLFDL